MWYLVKLSWKQFIAAELPYTNQCRTSRSEKNIRGSAICFGDTSKKCAYTRPMRLSIHPMHRRNVVGLRQRNRQHELLYEVVFILCNDRSGAENLTSPSALEAGRDSADGVIGCRSGLWRLDWTCNGAPLKRPRNGAERFDCRYFTIAAIGRPSH